MDINGAKALRERLGSKRADDATPPAVDIPEDAPPVYHWLGVPQAGGETPREDGDAPTNASLFQKLGLSFR